MDDQRPRSGKNKQTSETNLGEVTVKLWRKDKNLDFIL